MPIEGVDFTKLPFEDAIQLVMRVLKVDRDTAEKIAAAEQGLPFNDVVEPDSKPLIDLDTNDNSAG